MEKGYERNIMVVMEWLSTIPSWRYFPSKGMFKMTSRERTAYPRFKPVMTDRDLYDLYTPTEDDLQFLKQATRQEPVLRLNVLLLLKTFQALGYFPDLSDIPEAIIDHVRLALKIPQAIAPAYNRPKPCTAIMRLSVFI